MEQETPNTREENIRELYSPEKLNTLRRLLDARSRTGNPYYFKIQVSGIVVVERTNDLSKFDSYEELLPGEGDITIWIYTNEKTPNYYMKKVYTMEGKPTQHESRPQPENLGGLGVAILRETELMMKADRLQGKLDLKEEKLKDMAEKLSDAEEYIEKQDERIEQLKKEIENLKSKRRLQDRELGELLVGGAEGLIRRNPHWLAKFKGGEALAGIIENDNQEKEEFEKQNPEQDTEATFSKKKEGAEESLSEEEKDFLKAMKYIRDKFSEEEYGSVMHIVAHFSRHKDDIPVVTELLNIKE